MIDDDKIKIMQAIEDNCDSFSQIRKKTGFNVGKISAELSVLYREGHVYTCNSRYFLTALGEKELREAKKEGIQGNLFEVKNDL